MFRDGVLADTAIAYRRLTEYYRDIRSFFETPDAVATPPR